MPARISQKTEKIVLKEEKKNPHFGVRRLKEILNQKYNLNISKSKIANILKKYNKITFAGRKPYFLLYSTTNTIKYFKIFLLLCIDINLEITTAIAEELKIYAKRQSTKMLEKIIRLFTFSSYLKESL
ncbi:MAG: helix-turn-helix domain-containing protein, partial [Candidatus Omnitrophica bacterium]|nr:helix-turn-helix domain-containing protein [Candidatus Omnitrophota bacterium]